MRADAQIAANMEEDRSDMIAQFCAITGAPAHIGENYLIAHDWALERAVDFYMDHPPQQGAADEAPDPFDQAAGVPVAQPDVVEIPDDDDEAAGLGELARQRASALQARQQAEQQMEDMMGSAQEMFRRSGIELPPDMLAVHGRGLGAAAGAAAAGPSSRPRRSSGGRAPAAAPADLMETDPAFMDAYDDDGFAAAAGEQYGSLHRRQQEQMLQHYQQLARQREAAAAAPPIRQRAAAAAAGDAAAGVDDDEAAAAEAAADAADAAAAAAAVTGVAVGDDEAPLDLPEGINLEEARMLEAAMLGIPYQGRMPDFSNAAAAAAGPPLSPGAMEQRSLRAEQDAAYEESLALDRAKQESIAAAQEAAEAQELAEQEAAAAAAQAEADAARALAELLQSKRQRLESSPEPAAGEAGSFTVVVRLPDGSRKGRRFRGSDQLQAVFDFVDVQCSGADAAAAAAAGGSGGAAGSDGGCGGVRPGAYRLVTQFPRKVYVEGSSQSLADAGITSDSALFIEQL